MSAVTSGVTPMAERATTGSGRARWIATRPKPIESIARRKCDCTRKGCRSPRTARPPTTPLPRIVASTTSDGTLSPRRAGRTRNAPIAISSVGMPTRPLTSRLICSMAACPLDTSMKRSLLQFGQSSQPRPLPVRRTTAPATVKKHTPATVRIAIWRIAAQRHREPSAVGIPYASQDMASVGRVLSSFDDFPDPPDVTAGRPDRNQRHQPLRPLLLQRLHQGHPAVLRVRRWGSTRTATWSTPRSAWSPTAAPRRRDRSACTHPDALRPTGPTPTRSARSRSRCSNRSTRCESSSTRPSRGCAPT